MRIIPRACDAQGAPKTTTVSSGGKENRPKGLLGPRQTRNQGLRGQSQMVVIIGAVARPHLSSCVNTPLQVKARLFATWTITILGQLDPDKSKKDGKGKNNNKRPMIKQRR